MHTSSVAAQNLEQGCDWDQVYREFVAEVRAVPMLQRPPSRCYLRLGLVLAGFVLFYGLLLTGTSGVSHGVAVVGLTVVMVQGGLLAHDLVHGAYRTGRGQRELLTQFLTSTLSGWGAGYWKVTHAAHHRHTNDPRLDPDIQVEWFAFSEDQAQRKSGLARVTTRWQHILLWPAVTLQVFSARASSLAFIRSHWKRTRNDRFGLAAHLLLWLLVPALVHGWERSLSDYFLATWLGGFYIAGAFMWNHVGSQRSHSSESLPYLLQRIAESRDLSASGWSTVLFGGLNFQVEHHLLPSIPSYRLRHVRPVLARLCQRYGIEFRVLTWREAMADVHRQLRAYGQAVPGVGVEA